MPPTPQKPSRWNRISPVLQPLIIKLYKVAGIVSLSVILLGLIAYLTVTVFYFLDRSWVRPVILSPEHHRVVEASTGLADAKMRRSELEAEQAAATAELAQIDRMVAANEKFEATVAGLAADAGKNPQAALVRREVDKSVLERQAAGDRRAALQRRIKELDVRTGEQDVVINRLAASPYMKATKQRKVVAFVPYQNLRNAQPGTRLYGCSWGLVMCSRIGKIVSLLDGEVQETHPHDDSLQRGVLVEIELTDAKAAENPVLFAGGKPLFVL
jgi:hypothetical protein